MKMKKSAFYLAGFAAIVALGLAACHKSSTSSSSGSLAGATGALSSGAFNGGAGVLSNGVHVASLRPHAFTSPCGSNMTLSPTNPSPSIVSGSCTAPDGTTSSNNQQTITMSFSEIMSSCTINGYTFNGTLSFAAPESGKNFTICESTNTGGPFEMNGSLNFTGSPLSVSGSGINLSGTTNINISVTDNNGSVSGSVGGTAFGQPIQSASF